MIYLIGGLKGGTGKTTIATNLAVELARWPNNDVLLIDADAPQHSSNDFTIARENALDGATGFSCYKLIGKEISRELPKLKTKYTDIVIDAGGKDSISQRAALMLADVYLVPFNPRSLDLWTADNVKSILEEIQAVRSQGAITAYSFLNRADARGQDNREAGEALRAIEGITYIDSPITNRKSFSNAISKGMSVLEGTDQKAIAEIKSLFSSILNSK
jgi:chromosome partitioning protein